MGAAQTFQAGAILALLNLGCWYLLSFENYATLVQSAKWLAKVCAAGFNSHTSRVASILSNFRTGPGAIQPLSRGYQQLFLSVLKRVEREVDH